MLENETLLNFKSRLSKKWGFDDNDKGWDFVIETPTGPQTVFRLTKNLVECTQFCLISAAGDTVLMERCTMMLDDKNETEQQVFERRAPCGRGGHQSWKSWRGRNANLFPAEGSNSDPSWFERQKEYDSPLDLPMSDRLFQALSPGTFRIAAHFGSKDMAFLGALLASKGPKVCADINLICTDVGRFALVCCEDGANSKQNKSGVSFTQGSVLWHLVGEDLWWVRIPA